MWHNYAIAKLLIAKNADVNAVNTFGTTALIQAVRNNNLELINLLVDKGADVNYNQGAALMCAIENGYKFVAETLIENGTKITVKHGAALLQAYSGGHQDLARLLLDHHYDKAGHSAADLIVALEQGHRQLADMYIAKAASDNVMAKNSTLTLIQALQRGHKELAAILATRKKADIVSQPDEFQTDSGEQDKNTSDVPYPGSYRAMKKTDFVLLLIYNNYSFRDKAFDLLSLFCQQHDACQRHLEKRLSNNPRGELTVFGVKRVVDGRYYIVMQNPDSGFLGSMEHTLLVENNCAAQKKLVLTYQEILGFSRTDARHVLV